jgi:hypothetical protein
VAEEPYRAPIPPTPDPYRADWEDLRSRRGLAWTSVVSTGVLSVIVPPAVGAPLAASLLLPVAFIAARHVSSFRCPHCGANFGLRRRCGGCRIPIGTPKAAALDAAKQHQRTNESG